MPLKFLEMPVGASGYKNQSNDFLWCYSQGNVTLKDASGNTVVASQAPCWVPPGWTINTGTSTDILFALQGQIREFAGFLSRAGTTFPPKTSSIGFSAPVQILSAADTENETFSFPVPLNSSESESEAWVFS